MFLRGVALPVLCISAFLVLGVPSTSHATLFQNSYVSFELPPSWQCNLDGTEWVCISNYAKQAKEAIIILTAKEMGPADTLANYETRLKTPRELPDKTGKVVPSQVLQVKQRMINNHPWVDALHLGSEISSYYTRYLATVKDKIAILVTFSAHKEHYTQYSGDFLKAVESLRVVAAKDILDAKSGQGGVGAPSGTIGNPIAVPDTYDPNGGNPPEPTPFAQMKTKILALALLLGAIGFYLWRRKKN